MTEQESNTQKLILEAAKKVFLSKGLDGARMQEIADEAGINKALLHYYFRSKDKLFDAIFEDVFQQFLPKVSLLIFSDKPFIEKIWAFVDTYLDVLLKNPLVPIFILHELSRNPERIVNLFMNQGVPHEFFQEMLRKEIESGQIKQVNPIHLIVNIISMCVFPIAAKPILKGVLFSNDDEAYDRFLQERKTEVTLFIINAIKAN
jgi:AcrR family transcriptional regulator